MLISCVLLGLLSGCLQKKPHKSLDHKAGISENSSSVSSKAHGSLENEMQHSWNTPMPDHKAHIVCQQEARLIDIPIPLHALAIQSESSTVPNQETDSLVLAYRVNSKYRDIGSFYTNEMERLGWNMISSVYDVESLLVFIKPQRVCAISLRNYAKNSTSSLMIITSGKNKAGYSQE